MPSTFVGYRRGDAAGYAGRLHESLERRLGRDAIFRDVDTLEPGQDFVEAIEQRLGECKVFLALIGQEWLDARDPGGARRLEHADDYVRLEIAAALARSEVRVIPVLIEGAVMPSPEALPQDIRGLTRRQAVSIRDEAWDHDVDRLAAVIAKLTARPLIAASTVSAVSRRLVGRLGVGWIAAAAVLVALSIVVSMFSRDRDSVGTEVQTSAPEPSVPSVETPAADASPAYRVPVPRIAEVVHASLIYSLLSASVTPNANDASELRLRFRFSNEGPYDANAWDASFRLVAGGRTLAPTGGLNEIVQGQSVKDGIVTFTVPSSARRVIVRVVDGNRAGDLPLDLSPTGRQAEDERADVGDASSLAIVRSIVREPRVLTRGEDLIVTVLRGTSRRFANAVRLNFVVRLAAPGNYPVHSSAATLRLVAGDSVVAPLESPNVVVQSASDVMADVEFEVSPSTTRVVLKGSALNNAGELAIDVPPAP